MCARQSSQAIGADHLVIVFGNAFAAKIAPAARAPRDCFALGMVKAALVGQVGDHAGSLAGGLVDGATGGGATGIALSTTGGAGSFATGEIGFSSLNSP